MDDVYENIDDYTPSRKRKILIFFDDMIADIKSNKTLQAIIEDLFIRCRKLNISLVFITVLFGCSEKRQTKFNTLFDYEINSRKNIQNIAINHFADIDYRDFMKIYRECTK